VIFLDIFNVYKNLEILARLSQNEDFKQACAIDNSLREKLDKLILKQTKYLNTDKESVDDDFQQQVILAEEEERQRRRKVEEYLSKEIDELNLTVRTYNCLKRAGIDTLRKVLLLSPKEVSNIRNLGHKNVSEVLAKKEEIQKTINEI